MSDLNSSTPTPPPPDQSGSESVTEDITLAQEAQTVLQPSLLHAAQRMLDDDVTVNQSTDDTEFQSHESVPSALSIEAWLDKLKSSDRAFYNIMAMEVWSLAKSMDSMTPGFWNRFMDNRRTAMQEFVDRRRQTETEGATEGTDDEFTGN
jgi:hypothetical protein